MTREEIMTLGFEDLETRAAEIAAETAEADMDQIEALNSELDAIEERKAALKVEVEERKKTAEAVANGAGKQVEIRKEDEKMTNKEVRNTPEYIEAFAKYIKTGKDAECRALLTENVSGGTVPVPEFVEQRVRTAWERNELWNRITKTYVRGNLKVGFEISATDAAAHLEGAAAPAEETLVLGVINLIPLTIKKWITFSTEVMALGAEDFLAYIYDELTYKIIQFAVYGLLASVVDAPDTSSAEDVGIPKVAGAVTPATILQAIGLLSDNAQDRVFVASGATIAAVRTAALEANYAYDPFFGLTVIQNDSLTTGAVIGDFAGAQANLPEGDSVRFVFDEYSLAEKDLIKLVGRMYVALSVVQPGMFAVITGTAESE